LASFQHLDLRLDLLLVHRVVVLTRQLHTQTIDLVLVLGVLGDLDELFPGSGGNRDRIDTVHHQVPETT